MNTRALFSAKGKAPFQEASFISLSHFLQIQIEILEFLFFLVILRMRGEVRWRSWSGGEHA